MTPWPAKSQVEFSDFETTHIRSMRVIPLFCGSHRSVVFSGTAFVLDSQKGLLGTARHITEKSSRFMAKVGERWVKVMCLTTHLYCDAAVLGVKNLDRLTNFSGFRQAKMFDLYEPVRIIGYVIERRESKKKLKKVVIRGKLNILESSLPVHFMVDVQLQNFMGGISGGPVLNIKSEVIGIVRGQCCDGFSVVPIGRLLEVI